MLKVIFSPEVKALLVMLAIAALALAQAAAKPAEKLPPGPTVQVTQVSSPSFGQQVAGFIHEGRHRCECRREAAREFVHETAAVVVHVAAVILHPRHRFGLRNCR